MNNKAWSQLPNAHHIDRVSESLRTHNDIWTAARDAVCLTAARDAAWDAAWDATRAAARLAALGSAFDAVWDAPGPPRDSPAGTPVDPARSSAWDVMAALVAWDDCGEYLSMTYKELYVWAELSGTPQAILLLPLKWVQEHECLVTPA